MKHLLNTRVLIAVLTATLIAGCASDGDIAGPIQDVKQTSDRRLNKLSAEVLYLRARRALDTGAYSAALALFDRIDTRFPFSEVARQAQLERAYAHYRQFNEGAAVAATNRFINQYPRHENIAYAYYLKGLATFRVAAPDDDNWYSADYTTRDISAAREAFFAFAQVANGFPNSAYAKDSRQRMLHLRDRMAKHYLNIMKYYERKRGWVAVVNRGKQILEEFQGSQHIPQVLTLMAESYEQLGLNDLAADTRKLLKNNYKNAAQAGPESTSEIAPPALQS